MRRALCKPLHLLILLCVLGLPVAAQDLDSFEKRTTVKKLTNGLTLIVVERPDAPVFSFFTMVDAGATQDPMGRTGLAHMMEHQAFKGTPNLGTKDWAKEKVALEKVEKAYAAYSVERQKTVGRDEKKLAELEKAWKDAIADAASLVEPNEFSKIVDQNGGVGVNAFTNYDETGYFYSLPSNRLELWAYLESERFLHPTMQREFYTERDVVIEERRIRTDSSSQGRLLEQFLAAAFTAHPYRRPAVGYMSDLSSFSATDAEQFFKTYYIPANIVVAVVGHVKASQVVPIVEKYFGRIPSRPKPPEQPTEEPPQNAERMVVLREASQPFYIEGYHRPDYRHPDDAVYDVISDLMRGRASRLYRALVRDKKIAAAAAGFSTLPGNKYSHLYYFLAIPLPGHTPQEMGDAIHEEIERLKKEDVSDEELEKTKARAKVNLIRALGSNQGLARQFAYAQMRYSDWRHVFRSIEKIEEVTKADIRRVANQLFRPSNRTVGMIESTQMARPAGGAPAAPKGGQQ